MSTRTCVDCSKEVPYSGLVKAKGCKQGVRKLCKPCSVLRVRRSVDPVDKAAYDAEYRAKNSDKVKAYDRARATLPHRRALSAEACRRRRLDVEQQTPVWADKEGVQSMYVLAQRLSSLTGVELQVDHIVPLRGEEVCGFHSQHNLQLLERTLNIAKGNKPEPHYQLPRGEYK